MNRRQLLAAMGLTAAAWMVGCAGTRDGAGSAHGIGSNGFNVKRFGAGGDGRALDSPAINRAIEAAFNTGGGTVYVPPGVYRSGTIILKSNVTLYVEAGATILGSTKIDDYTGEPGPPINGDANPRHLIFA